MSIYYIGDKFVKDSDSVIPVNDMIVLRGYGIFDFMRTYGGRPFYLKEHIKRLENSGKYIGLKLPETPEKIYDIVMETLSKNDHGESNIRIVVTGGVSPDSVTPQGNGLLMVMVTPKHNLPQEWYTKGVKIVTNKVERFIPEAKSTNYLSAVIAQQQAKAAGAVESVYVDRQNRILEGTTTNIFVFKGGKLVTPRADILPGITRQVVLELLKNEFQIEIRDLKADEISSFEEVFITASNKEVVPVIQIDDTVIGEGRLGDRNRKVLDIFKKYTDEYGRK